MEILMALSLLIFYPNVIFYSDNNYVPKYKKLLIHLIFINIFYFNEDHISTHPSYHRFII